MDATEAEDFDVNLDSPDVELMNASLQSVDENATARQELMSQLKSKLGSELSDELHELAEASDDATLIQLVTRNAQKVVRVMANNPYWHAGFLLGGSHLYHVMPSPTSRWQLLPSGNPYPKATVLSYGSGIEYHPKHWSEIAAGNAPWPRDRLGRVLLGYVYVLIWHHQPDGSAKADVRRLHSDGFEFETSPHGGSMHFYIADVKGTHGDNQGSCLVKVTGTGISN